MKKFLLMLLAVLFCTSAMCICDVYADQTTSTNASNTKNETIQDSISNIKSTALNTKKAAYSDEEVYLTAQLVHHEAHNQAYNGKVAIAEVVLNRVNSGLFPDQVESVIFQSGQFASTRRLKNINPTEMELRIAYNVLNGNLRVLNNDDIMYFRNPKVTSGISADTDKDWGSLDYETHIGDHAFYSQEAPVALVADNDTKVEKTEKKSIFDKIPGVNGLTKLFSLKKNQAKSSDADKAELSEPEQVADEKDEAVNEEVALLADVEADALVLPVEEELSEEEKALNEAEQLEYVLSAQYYAQLAAQTGDALDEEVIEGEVSEEEDTEVVEAQEEVEATEEAVLVPVVVEAENDVAVEALDAVDTEDPEEEYDENDPIAVARHNAYVAEKQKKAEQLRLLEEERLANLNAQKQAVMLDQMEVDRVARENAEVANATKAAVNRVIAMQGR